MTTPQEDENLSRVIRFYTAENTDHRGRYIQDIWAFDHFWLEYTHDYIQWLFPIPEQGRFNQFAPVLHEADQVVFRKSEELRQRQRVSLDVMLDFLGLVRKADHIVRQADLCVKHHSWLKPGGHNHLRITRMIRSLYLCGQKNLAETLQSTVIDLGQKEGLVSERSIEFWRSATN